MNNFKFFRQALFYLVATLSLLPAEVQAQVSIDDLQLRYHGLVLDKNRRVVEVDETDIERLYSELADRYESLYSAPQKLSGSLDAALPGLRLATQPSSTQKANLRYIDFLVDSILFGGAESPPPGYVRILRLLRILRDDGTLLRNQPANPELAEFYDLYSTRNAYTHVRCEDDSVPVPPDYGDSRWRNRTLIGEELSMTQIESGATHYYPETEIYFYESNEPAGICSLLLRYRAMEVGSSRPKKLKIAGAICQSADTKRACFWENTVVSPLGEETILSLAALESDHEARKIAERWLNSASSTTNNHLSLACPVCHSGNNAFVFYPDQLCYPSGSCLSDKSGKLTDPIGYDDSPVKIQQLEPSFSANLCTRCHDIVFPNQEFYAGTCALIEFVATKDLMPPWPETHFAEELTWKEFVHIPSSNRYKDSFLALRAFCKD